MKTPYEILSIEHSELEKKIKITVKNKINGKQSIRFK